MPDEGEWNTGAMPGCCLCTSLALRVMTAHKSHLVHHDCAQVLLNAS